MNTDYQIPAPFLFNPMKHHLGYIRDFINRKIDQPSSDTKDLVMELKHIGTSVMDVYTGLLSIRKVSIEIELFLKQKELLEKEDYARWAGIDVKCHRIISLSDDSQWTLKYNDNTLKFVHIFPARGSKNTFRVKANTLKSALLYYILIGKDLVTVNDLNSVRPFLGLSPVKDTIDTDAILQMIEILRASGPDYRIHI